MAPVDWTPLLWFGAVIALIPLALWLLKRTPLGGGAGSGPVRHVAVLPLSASQRVATSRWAAAQRAAGWCWASARSRSTPCTRWTRRPMHCPLAAADGGNLRATAVTPAAQRMSRYLNRAARIGVAAALLGLGWHRLARRAARGLPLVVGQGAGGTSYSVPIQTLLFFTALSFLPAVLLLMTGFTRIVIVLSLLRQALGTQAAPPNQVIVG